MLAPLQIGKAVSDVYAPKQFDPHFFCLDCQLHIISQLDANLNAMHHETQGRKREADAPENHQAINIGVDFECWDVEEGDCVVDEVQLLQKLPQCSARDVASKVELEQADQEYYWVAYCSEDPVQEP